MAPSHSLPGRWATSSPLFHHDAQRPGGSPGRGGVRSLQSEAMSHRYATVTTHRETVTRLQRDRLLLAIALLVVGVDDRTTPTTGRGSDPVVCETLPEGLGPTAPLGDTPTAAGLDPTPVGTGQSPGGTAV